MRRRFFLSPEAEPGAPPAEPPKAETVPEPPKAEPPKAENDEGEPKWFKPYRKTLRRIESDYLTRQGQQATAAPPTEPVTVVVQEKETPEPKPEPEKSESPDPPAAPAKRAGGTMLRRNRLVR